MSSPGLISDPSPGWDIDLTPTLSQTMKRTGGQDEGGEKGRHHPLQTSPLQIKKNNGKEKERKRKLDKETRRRAEITLLKNQTLSRERGRRDEEKKKKKKREREREREREDKGKKRRRIQKEDRQKEENQGKIISRRRIDNLLKWKREETPEKETYPGGNEDIKRIR